MLLVRSKVGRSTIEGLGVFTLEDIRRGAIVWRFTPGFDLKFTEEQIAALPELAQTYVSRYSWRSRQSGLYCFCSDDAKYFNHSDTPNVLSEYRENEDEVVTVAQRDILCGEELTDNYDSFE